MSKINYKSDFDFTLRIYECTVGPDGQKTRVEMGFPTYDFEIRLYTTNRANAYICSKKGNKLQNCFNDEGKIHVVCDNHHLGKGVLHAEFTAFLPNNIYPDGSRKTVEVSHTVIELVDGSGDSPSIDDLKLTPAFVSDQGEALRVEAENKRVEAEAERKVAEATRTDSEAQRVEAEAKRNADEAKRIEAENKRKTTEAQRAESEALRDNTEAQRCEAEAQRVAAENLRKTDEEARKTAETQRVTAENERKAAEAQRAKDFEAIKQEVAVEDRIGIFPFNSIVEAHGSVSDDAPDYATQFPSAADGAYRHIIFDKSRRTFLWEIHAGDYPDCPAGDAYTSWKGSEEYVSNGHPRTDRLFRLNNNLYRWKDGVLQPIEAPNGTLTLETGEASYNIPISVGASVKNKKVGRYEDMVLTASVKNNELYLETSRPLADDEYAALLTCGPLKRKKNICKGYSKYRWHVRRQYYPDVSGRLGCKFTIDADGLWKCNDESIRERLLGLSGGSDSCRAYYCHKNRKKLPTNGRPFTVTYGVAIYKKDDTPPLKRKSNMVYFYIDYQNNYDAETGDGKTATTIHL